MSSSKPSDDMIRGSGLRELFPAREALVTSRRAREPLHEGRDAVPAQFAARLGIGGHVVELHREALTGEAPVAMPGGRTVGEHQQRAIHGWPLHRVVIEVVRATQQAQTALVLRPRV